MRELLSKPEYRQLQVVEALYNGSSISITNLCKRLDVSDKTLREDIQKLNHLLTPSEINISAVSGLTLVLGNHMSIESIYSRFLDRSTEFKIIEHVFFRDFEALDHLAEHLFISTSTLRRMITNINKNLKLIDFKIDSQTLDLVGDEKKICNFIIHYFDEKYRDSSAIFPNLQLQVINQILLHGLKSKNIPLNYPDLEKLRIWTMVIIYRIKAGHCFTYSKKQHAKIPKNIVSNPLFKRLFKTTFSISLTEDVFIQIFYFLFNKNFCATVEQLQILSKKDTTIDAFVTSLGLFLEDISMKFSIELKNKEELILNLFNLDSLYYGKSYILYNRYQAFIELSTHDYSNFYKFIKREIKKNAPIKNKNWSNDKINNVFYILITHWTDLAHEIEKKIKIFSVGLFFNTDIEHITMIKDQLSYFFENKLTFTIIDDLSINSMKKNARNYDILLTNLFNIEIKKTKIIVLSLTLTTSDIQKIDEAYIELLNLS